MKITDEAKIILTEVLASNECDCIRAMQQESCCGTSLYFVTENMQEGDSPILINGIPVLMDNQTQVRAETVTLATEDGKLIIQDISPSCCS
jgi:hypothetical protein